MLYFPTNQSKNEMLCIIIQPSKELNAILAIQPTKE